METKQFKVKPNGFKEVRNKVLLKLVPLFLIAITIGFAISYFNMKQKDGDLTSTFIALPILLIYGTISIFRSLKRRKQIFESFTLSIDNNSIWRDLKNTPSIHLFRTEIEEINILPNKSITIKSKQKENLIWIPSQLEDFEELKSILSEIKPLKKDASLPKKITRGWILIFLSLGVLAITFISTIKWLVTLAGIALLSFSIWLIRETRKSNNIDYKTKRSMLWYVVLMVAVIAKVIYTFIA